MMKTINLFVCVVLLCNPAKAAEGLPNWDMKAFCNSQLPAGATASVVADCVELQNEARQRVSAVWTNVTVDQREECLNYVKSDEVPPSYFRLDVCFRSALNGR